MNVTTVSTGTGTVTLHPKTYKIEMIDDGNLSMASDDDDDDLISSDGSLYGDTDIAQIAVQDDVANQLAAAGPVGVAAAAAIASSKKRKRPHSFETNPSVRKRQQNRLLRKLRGIIYEFTGRVGKQAVVLVATPGKPNTSYKVFGAKPLEDVLRNLKNIVMDELENALAQQAPPPPQEDPTLFELPPLIIDGIPTPVEKMTQAQLRAFIPLMLKYSTGRGKPGWGRESTRPPWWPKELPWANVRMDARSEDDKQKISWTHALRKIVINCYKYHGREDLLPTFADEEESKVGQLICQTGDEDEEDDEHITTTTTLPTVSNVGTNTGNHVNVVKINSAGTVITTHNSNGQNGQGHNGPTIIQSTNNQHITTTATLPASTKIELCSVPAQSHHQQQQQHQQLQQQQLQQQQQHHQTSNVVLTTQQAQSLSNAANQVVIDPMTLADVDYTQNVLTTIQNADGTVSLIQVDPNNPIITLPDGTTAQVQGVATLHQGEGGATIQTVQGLSDVNGHENMTVDLTEATVAQDGQIYITTEDGQGYPISVSNMITVPVSASMYQSMMANIQQIHTNSDGTVCITPMQVDTNLNNNNSSQNQNQNNNNNNNNYQCYSLVTPTPGLTMANGSTPRLIATMSSANLNNSNNNNNSSTSCSSNSDSTISSRNANGASSSSSNSSSNNNSANNQTIRCQILNPSSLSAANSSQNHNEQQQHQHHPIQQLNINANALQLQGTKLFLPISSGNQTAIINLNSNMVANSVSSANIASSGKIGRMMSLPIVVTTPNSSLNAVVSSKDIRKQRGSKRRKPSANNSNVIESAPNRATTRIPIKIENVSSIAGSDRILNIQIIGSGGELLPAKTIKLENLDN